MNTLKERMADYENISEYRLVPKLPLIISLNGRSFRKLTSTMMKPYDEVFDKIMGQTLIKLMSEIEGTVFAYSFNDEIHIVCRNDKTNDTECWYNNDVQRIISVASSLASISFYDAAKINNARLLGLPVFLGKTFILPSITETINYLIAKQHKASQTAISNALFYELLKTNNADKTQSIMKNLTMDQKYDLLIKDCNVDLQSFPLNYWRGLATYRAPRMFKINGTEEIKHKLIIDDDLKFFDKDKTFLTNIFK